MVGPDKLKSLKSTDKFNLSVLTTVTAVDHSSCQRGDQTEIRLFSFDLGNTVHPAAGTALDVVLL
ncbi:hypothetical protein Asal01_01731 [Fodinibius salicampi]